MVKKTLEFTPFRLGDLEVTEISVSSMNFVEFVKATAHAQDTKSYHRARMKSSVQLNGKQITDEQIPLLPIPVGKKILDYLEAFETGTGGSVTTPDANGVDAPIIFKLGTPLQMKTGKGEAQEILELEFMAKTYGDLEDALAETTPMRQAVELLRRTAVPLGTSLTILPEALLNQVSIMDGILIAQKVVPPFVD